MATDETPFEDVRIVEGGLSLPELKWRELLFVGALRRVAGDTFVRDPARPLPAFRVSGLFPEGQAFTAVRDGDRVVLRRAS
jgi:hypothetical protein